MSEPTETSEVKQGPIYIVIHGGPATGKTINAAAMMKHYRCDAVMDWGSVDDYRRTVGLHRVMVLACEYPLPPMKTRFGRISVTNVMAIPVEVAAMDLGDQWIQPIPNYRREMVPLNELKPVPEEVTGWHTANEVPAPIDGTEIVITGNLSCKIDDDLYDVSPICGMVRYETGPGWVCAATGMAIEQIEGDELVIQFWIEVPIVKEAREIVENISGTPTGEREEQAERMDPVHG